MQFKYQDEKTARHKFCEPVSVHIHQARGESMHMHVDLQNRKKLLESSFEDVSPEMKSCIRNCIAGHQICVQAYVHCVKAGGALNTPKYLNAIQDCADLCSIAADFMIRNSELHPIVCGTCAQACMVCAVTCDDMRDEDQMLQNCADICRLCVQSCQKMAANY